MAGSRIVIAGGGVGGIEAALALRAHLGTGSDITLLSRERAFRYRPWSVTRPFREGGDVTVDLEALAAERGVRFALGEVRSVDPDERVLVADSGEHAYDHLVLALGARPVEVVRGAFTFRGPDNAQELAGHLSDEALGEDAAVAFVATKSSVWSLPAYELALMTAERAARTGSGVTTMLVIAEAAPLEDFGPENSAQVAQLLRERGVELVTETIPDAFDGSRLYVPMAGTLSVDFVVALPGLLGRPVEGLPHDAGGFVPVDDHCRVDGTDFVYAVGDMTARPLKQGGLAAQQADVAARSIAAALGEPIAVEPYRPVLRAMLLTGAGPVYLRHPREDGVSPHAYAEAPWWPPHKISGKHLAPYLAAHGEVVHSA